MGCDLHPVVLSGKRQSFNPRTRMGCDKVREVEVFEHLVSIHAPAWGATSPYVRILLLQNRFNPRTRMGCDRFAGQ